MFLLFVLNDLKITQFSTQVAFPIVTRFKNAMIVFVSNANLSPLNIFKMF